MKRELGQKAVIIMGSKSDLDFCEKIKSSLASYSIESDTRIASAHRSPEYLLKLLREYADSGDQIVAITVAGLSDALSGVVAAQRLFPVLACPPDLEKHDLPKVFSSAYTPTDVPVAFVNDPVKASHFVAQIFALTNKQLAASIAKAVQDKKTLIEKSDTEINRSSTATRPKFLFEDQ
ncbi:MAG: AIR carboxylase family protein [Rhabdochlamydiaceae bacterium]